MHDRSIADADDGTRFLSLPTDDSTDAARAVSSPAEERFQRLRLLGSGACGEVYLAHDHELNRRVALKVAKLAAAGPVPRLLDEARATARVQHPNVVAVLDAGSRGRQEFIAFEYVEGRNLRRHVESRRPPEVMRLLCEIAAGLAAAHEASVLHLDVKPENVLVGVDSHARLLDFGIARFLMGGRCILSEGSCVGTPAYMAPEVWLDEGVCDGTDAWSFAVLACELLTARRLFQGYSHTEILTLVLDDDGLQVPPLPDVPPDVVHLIHESLRRDRNRRPYMRDFVAALSSLANC